MRALTRILTAEEGWRHRRRQGYTLAEAVVGLGLLALTVGALYTGITYGIRRTDDTRQEMRATQILLEKVEAVRLYTWDKIAYGFDPDDPEDWTAPFDDTDPHLPGDEPEPFVIPTKFDAPFTPGRTNSGELIYHGTLTITNAPVTDAYGNELLLVKVGLEWENRGRKRQRQVQTLFARYGMQNNVRR